MYITTFLRPTKAKVVLLIILCFCAICAGVAAARLRVELREGVENGELKVGILEGVEMILLWPTHVIARYTTGPNVSLAKSYSFDLIYSISPVTALLALIALICYWYFLSCIVFTIYHTLWKKI